MTKEEQVLKILELAMQYNSKSKSKKIMVNYSGHVQFITVWIVKGFEITEYLLSCYEFKNDTVKLQETINKIQEMINAPRRPTHTSRR